MVPDLTLLFLTINFAFNEVFFLNLDAHFNLAGFNTLSIQSNQRQLTYL